MRRRSTHRVRGAASALVVLLSVGVASCVDSPPPIGRGVSTKEFDRHVQERFPIGSSEAALLTELRRQHFTVKPATAGKYQFSAQYLAKELFCNSGWSILWSAEDGKITAITGEFLPICL